MEKYVAITGGIGSGKTLALGIIKKAGYKVFSADEVYRDMLRDADFVKKVCSETGVPPIYEGDRLAIDRKAISALVFSDGEFLKKLAEAYPDACFMHSGDIDCGGFMIWKSRCEGTGIPFETYKMDIMETLLQHCKA